MVHLSTKSLGLVISAIKNLREIQGSTSREILHYISSVHDIPATKARHQVQNALKRGVAYGILKKTGGHYSLPTDSDIARQEVAIQEIDLLDLYCQRKINRSRIYKMQIDRGAKSRRAGCRCGRRRRRRRSRGCAPETCRRRQRRRRSRRRSRRGRCGCGGRGGCVGKQAATLEGTHGQKDDKLIGLDNETMEATAAVVGTEGSSRSSMSGSSSPERTIADNNTELRDRDMPLH
ncbi:uncharacterized protein LOC116845206 [Odontomachus brunneus]|uniref:uncharacterized protein LOC116845206 n=1 Tax=Odontomachus brunneus TaxID=486640 RepID=UPI0013F28785|nr:uncharacterized protein LOC116845206 [Odontomachus brunneus]XP_032673506.1 uncharacterized protein LOC116845206 [Odontomachus brunneus]